MHKHESDAPGALPSIVVTLPGPEVPYFPILSPPGSVTMRSGLVTLQGGGDVGEHSTKDHEEVRPAPGEGGPGGLHPAPDGS
jgi:hypothetical protein